MRKLLFQILVVTVLISCGRAPGNAKFERAELTVNERYPLPWTEPTTDQLIYIGKTFVENKIGDCGEYYVRTSSQDQGEFLVGCSADGATWTYYIVWPSISQVDGPHADSTIKKPR